MDVVAAHGVDAVRVLVNDVLVVEEELVRLHQLRVAHRQFVARDLVLEDVRELQVVVADRLAAEHDHGVRVDHVEPHQPNLLLSHDVDDLPVTTLSVQLLNGCPVRKSLIAHSVHVPFSKCTAVGAAHCLAELWQRLLPLGLNVEALALS